MCEWIISFKGRNKSGTYNVNFLWNMGSIYIMDNQGNTVYVPYWTSATP